ncbi:MAG TPA: PDZ domain-containing protein [Pyrinomonadaceae bacterium]|nr:PDZ domain-containing protein [Pyrinomonadaceae bacterium]
MTRESRQRSTAVAVWALAVLVFTALAHSSAQAQANVPYDKDRLLKVVRLNALSTKEIVQAIQRRGVSFQMTPAVEAEFRAINTPPSVLDALRANYRAGSAPTTPTNSTGRKPANAPSGPPLGKNEIITLLQNGVSAARVEQVVEARGVDFQLNPEITREIMAAGGTRSLVGAISEKSGSGSASSNSPAGSYSGIGAGMEDRMVGGQSLIYITGTAPNSPAARAGLVRGDRLVEVDGQSVIGRSADTIVNLVRGPSGSTVSIKVERAGTRRIDTLRITREVTANAGLPVNSGSGPSYDDLTDQATAAIANSLAASDVTIANYALTLLQQALRLDPSRPTAYQLLGYLQLYGFHNIMLAEQSMRAAIERGGSAVFYVAHDDGGVFSSSCEGSLFISKTSVSYKASNSGHAFETEKSKIDEAKLNSIVGAHLGAFHLKVKLEEGGKEKTRTFNFAPATKSQAESNLVVSLIRSY